jgi:hypothetical protein
MKDERIMIIGDDEVGRNLLAGDLKKKGYRNIVEKQNLLSITEIKGFHKIFLFKISCEKTLEELGFVSLTLPYLHFIKQDFTKSYDIYDSVGTYKGRTPFGNLKYKLYKI